MADASRSGAYRPARTRGLNPLGALAYLRKRCPEGTMEKVLSQLSKEDLVLLGAFPKSPKLRSTSWVPFYLQVRLLRAIDKVIGEGDYRSLFDVGLFMAQRDIPSVFRVFLKLGNPGWIMEVTTRMWRYYHDRGTWTLERTPVSVIATLKDHDEADEAFCATLTGWVTGALEVSGGHDVMVDHPVCMARGAPHCVFTTRWNTEMYEGGDDSLYVDEFDDATDPSQPSGRRPKPSSFLTDE
jgi:predicted hydrocarbon binding protein